MLIFGGVFVDFFRSKSFSRWKKETPLFSSSLSWLLSHCCRPLACAHISEKSRFFVSPSRTPNGTRSWLLISQEYLIMITTTGEKTGLRVAEAQDATRGRSLSLNDVHWKEESVYLIRDGEGERERGSERERECGGSEERARQKRGIFTLVWRIREWGRRRRKRRGAFLKRGSQGQSAKKWNKDKGIEGGGRPARGRRRQGKGTIVHLWTGWKSSRLIHGHCSRLVSTAHPFVFHLRLRQRAVLHGSPLSLSPLPS